MDSKRSCLLILKSSKDLKLTTVLMTSFRKEEGEIPVLLIIPIAAATIIGLIINLVLRYSKRSSPSPFRKMHDFTKLFLLGFERRLAYRNTAFWEIFKWDKDSSCMKLSSLYEARVYYLMALGVWSIIFLANSSHVVSHSYKVFAKRYLSQGCKRGFLITTTKNRDKKAGSKEVLPAK